MMKQLVEESFRMLDRADDALRAAKHDLQGDFFLAAVNRAYYAIFYCANSLLHLKNINVKTHQAVRTKFSEEYIKTNIFPSSVGENLRRAYNLREIADYDMDGYIQPQEAEKVISDAEDILRITQDYLKNFRFDI